MVVLLCWPLVQVMFSHSTPLHASRRFHSSFLYVAHQNRPEEIQNKQVEVFEVSMAPVQACLLLSV
jgi:hypothetical protein